MDWIATNSKAIFEKADQALSDIFFNFHRILNDMIDSHKIDEVINRIATRFNPDKIILFGSYANGTQNDNSDLDLLIVQDSDLPMQKRGFDIRMSLIGTMIPMDILFYTKSEFEEEKSKNSSFLSSAIKNSRIMYERAV